MEDLHLVASADHHMIIITLKDCFELRLQKQYSIIDYAKIDQILGQVNWHSYFLGCYSVDDYAYELTSVLLDAIHQCTFVRSACRRPRLPKYFVFLLRKKKKAWTFYKNSGDILSYLTARRTAQTAICQYRRNCENKLVYSNNRKAFFAHVNRNIRSEPSNITLNVNGVVLSDQEAVGVFLTEFSHNFSAVSNESLSDIMSDFNASQLYFSYNEQMVAEAMHNCSNSNNSPDGINFCLLKRISRHVVRPPNIVCQLPFNAGVFPSRWKHAVIVPLYKGKGDRSFSSSYRPISLCSCFGKIMEKLVHSQFLPA